MTTTNRATAVLLALALALATAACNASKEEKRLPGGTAVTSTSSSTTSTTPATPTTPPTTTAPATGGGRSCVAILNDGIQLLRDYSNAARGIVAPDESEYRARAQALLDEARSRGCEIPPAVEQFLQ